MVGIVPEAGGGDEAARPVSGGGQRASGPGRADGGAVGTAGGGKPAGVAGFDAAVPPGGYRWWYLDALSDDGRHGLTIIAFVGSVFSPYYARARRRGRADPDDHCALNVALYGDSGHRWSMTERGRAACRREASQFTIGPSAVRWEDGSLVVDIREVTVPIPGRLRGRVRLTPAAVCGHEVALDAAGQHAWRPVAPLARVEASFDAPRLSWSGMGYHDSNWGAVPLEASFRSWTWSRSSTPHGAYITYDTQLRDGSGSAFALLVDAQGQAAVQPPPPPVGLGTTFWRMERHTRAEGPVSLIATLEDSPFYTRSLLRTAVRGEAAMTFHESLSLERFANPVVQLMLPFRMPRRAW